MTEEMAQVQKGLEEFSVSTPPEDPQVDRLWDDYRKKRAAIEARLEDFRRLWRQAPEEDLFAEICFCILTPSSSALAADRAIRRLKESALLYRGAAEDIVPYLNEVQYGMNKARYIVETRNQLLVDGRWTIRAQLGRFQDPFALREWLASSEGPRGLGMKEAGHAARNLGLAGLDNDIAILDRHILRRLQGYGVIIEVPTAMSRKKYLEIEEKFRAFALKVEIPMGHLDLLWWSDATGRIFK
jgi:N-glycosylase/DNA lyase